MPHVIDASLTIAALLPDENDPAAEDAFHQAVADGAFAPAIWIFECANVFLVAERRGRITVEQRRGFIDDLFELPIRIEDTTRRQAATSIQDLAQAHGLTIYDAAYLELATRTGASLGTRDRRLIAAAQSLKIRLF